MTKYLIPTVLGFMALSLTRFMMNESFEAVVMFAVSGGIFAFLVWLDRHQDDQFIKMRKELEAVKSKVDSLTLAKGLIR